MTNIVPETPHKRNNGLTAALLVGIIVLVGVAAFGLGRLSATQSPQSGIVIHEPGESSSPVAK